MKQRNGQGTEIINNKLIELLKKYTRNVIVLDSQHLLTRLLKSTASELTSGIVNNVEEWRVRWATYFNMKSWFDK